uniref:Ig-like domain-containing protein n=1 Tax=Gopherus evgoodei TaxID=1825980 RepID=A0A8C4WPE2_9SAUR
GGLPSRVASPAAFPGSGLPSTAQKSTLTLDPPWSIVFKGESVTLTCSTSHPPGRRFTWYRNNKVFRSTEINSLKIKYAQENDAGRYQCQASVFRRSDPVQLTISNGDCCPFCSGHTQPPEAVSGGKCCQLPATTPLGLGQGSSLQVRGPLLLDGN